MWPMAEVSSVRISSALFPASLASIMACMHSGVSGRNGPIPFPTKLRSLGARDEEREGDGEVCALDVKKRERKGEWKRGEKLERDRWKKDKEIGRKSGRQKGGGEEKEYECDISTQVKGVSASLC